MIEALLTFLSDVIFGSALELVIDLVCWRWERR
jgi:hypothetical protein